MTGGGQGRVVVSLEPGVKGAAAKYGIWLNVAYCAPNWHEGRVVVSIAESPTRDGWKQAGICMAACTDLRIAAGGLSTIMMARVWAVGDDNVIAVSAREGRRKVAVTH